MLLRAIALATLMIGCTAGIDAADDGGGGGGNGSGSGGSGSGSASGRAYGVLAGDPQYADEDYAAGIRWVSIELDWAAVEPSRGAFDAGALSLDTIAHYRAAGWKIELSFGLHGDPPDWVLGIEPWRDQDGATYGDGPNWFNASVQQAIADYLAYVVQTIGPENLDAVRIGGTSGAGEINYPEMPPYKYAAFSPSALAGTALVPKNPAPQCKPPSCSAHDAPIFFAWYVDALAGFCNFQVATLRGAGYQHDASWLFAGGGVTPGLKQLMLDHGLAPTADVPDDYHVAGGGIDEPELIANIADKGEHTVVTNTGIDDSSVAGADETSADPEAWSAPHWTAFNADRFMLRKGGENVGYQADGYDTAARMQVAFDVMDRFGYAKLMWAFDAQLRTEHGATVDDYARLIAR